MEYLKTLMLCLLLVGCTKEPVPSFQGELSAFVGTRSDEPLAGTIWEHQTGEDYNRYLYFTRDEVSLFYGLVEGGELQRWSDFYTAPYVLWDDGLVFTCLKYPKWGNEERVITVCFIRGNGYTIDINGDTYTYYGNNTQEIEGYWMTITATPVPWN